MHDVKQSLIVPLQELDSLASQSPQALLPVPDKGNLDSTMAFLYKKC